MSRSMKYLFAVSIFAGTFEVLSAVWLNAPNVAGQVTAGIFGVVFLACAWAIWARQSFAAATVIGLFLLVDVAGVPFYTKTSWIGLGRATRLRRGRARRDCRVGQRAPEPAPKPCTRAELTLARRPASTLAFGWHLAGSLGWTPESGSSPPMTPWTRARWPGWSRTAATSSCSSPSTPTSPPAGRRRYAHNRPVLNRGSCRSWTVALCRSTSNNKGRERPFSLASGSSLYAARLHVVDGDPLEEVTPLATTA